MAAFSVGDIVSAEISGGNYALGEIYRTNDTLALPYYYLLFHDYQDKTSVMSVIPFLESQLTFIATKEQYLLTNPEFFL